MGKLKFILELQLMTDIQMLIELKEQLKEQVMDKSIGWQQRILLYQKVQHINERIQQIRKERMTSS